VDNPSVAGWRSVAATPPLAGLAGATVAALNTYKKNFKKIKNQLIKQVKLCKNVNFTNYTFKP
jgi:hypothetical protein